MPIAGSSSSDLTPEEAREYFNAMYNINRNPKMRPTRSGWTGWLSLKSSMAEPFLTLRPLAQRSSTPLNFVSADTSGGSGGIVVPFYRTVIAFSQPQLDLLSQGYEVLRQSVYEGLFLQTRGKAYLDAIGLTIDDAGNVSLDYSGMEALLESKRSSDLTNGLYDTLDIMKAAGADLISAGWNGISYLTTTLRSLPATTDVQAILTEYNVKIDGDGNASFSGVTGSDIMLGGAGNDSLNGNDGNDILIGETGNDYLSGGDGNDLLDGGAGNDSLSGGTGNDLFLFSRGGGQDSINASDATVGKLDAVQFASDILPTDITVKRNGDSLVLGIAGSTDTLTVSNYFNSDAAGPYKVEEVRFADGTIWTVDQIKVMALIGTEGADTITGYATDDTINGLGGNDYIYGRAGNDTISGGAGADSLSGDDGNDTIDGGADNDYLYGGNGNDTLLGGAGTDYLSGDAGNDTLDGGAGNDSLSGGTGNDLFLFSRGGGQDSINASDATVGKLDAVQFASDILPTDITVKRNGDSLVLGIAGSTDTLTVSNYFNSDVAGPYKVEEVRFADGTIWTVDQIKVMALIGTEGADTITGYATDDTINGLGGNDYIYGRAGNDTISGGAGADSLSGDDGNDTIDGGADNDYLYGGNGNDTLLGGAGTDYLSGDAGNDTLDGGAGNDSLSGGTGNDLFLFSRGGGQDSINASDATVGKLDAVQFASDILPTDITVKRNGDSLVLGIAGSTDTLTVSNYFNSDAAGPYKVEEVRFADGTIWTVDQIKVMALIGTEELTPLQAMLQTTP